MSFLQTTLAVFLNNKIMTILSLFTFVFFVCTVALAVSNGKLNSELERYKKLTNISDPNSLSSTEIITKATTKSLTTTTMDPEIPNEFRLPLGLVKEIEYDLTLRPNLEHGTFSGEIIILFKLSEKSSFVKINSKGLKIDNVDINHNTDVKIGEERNEIIKLEIPRLVQELEPEKLHTLTIKFSGDMKNRIVGLYSSSYIGEDDKPRYIATSKFEPTYARQAFPCFDEPNYKARYTVHIEKPKGNNYIALSNMDVKNITDVDNNTEIVNFNPSVPMSTYLTCFIVCDFKFSETKLIPSIGELIALRVYATPAQVQKTKFSLDVAENCTLYYVDYFKIEYPLPKLDLIAIPDFVSGAMEHWGLVTFRETALLFDEKTSNSDNKQRVATVVAHELAHMWFGNLVTLDWWNDLWLNEGFATYLQFKACDHFLKDWGLLDQFLFDKVFPVMDFDATLASHPIVQTVSTPDQITEIFDAISYSKGAAVLRMLENAIGEEKFASGITKYLNQHKYGNAITINLWDQLQTTDPGFNVKDVMDTWTIQMGYPVVNVEEKNDEFILTQKRFLTDPDTINDSEISIFDYKYSIPITYSSDIASKIDTKSWFYWTDNSVSIAKPANATWVKINDKGSGFYRVNYSPKYWTDVLAKNVQNMDVSNRASLLDDIFSLAKAGEQKYNVALDFANVLSDEMDYVPWSVGIQRLTELKIFLKPLPNTYLRYQNFTHNLIKKVYNDLSWDEKPDETHQNNLLRGKVLNFGCSFGMTECLTKTKDSFNAWLNKDEAIPSNLKTIVFIYGMEDISSNDWHKFLTEKYIPEIDAQEKMKLLVGLTSTNRMDLLNELLMLAEDPNIVRSQDYFTCLEYISRNFAGTGLVWDYVRTNWLKLVDRFTLNNRYLGNLIPAITKTFSTTLKLEEMEAFFAKYPDAGAGQFARKNALETVKNNIKWINKYQNEVKEWLDDYQCDCI